MSNPCYFYDNVFDDSTLLSASTTDPSSTEYNINNVIDTRPYTFWQTGTSTGLKNFTIDTGTTATLADSFSIVGHNLGTLGLTVAIQHSSDNFVAITTVVTSSPPDDKAFGVGFNSTNNRYWRIEFNQPTTDKVKIGVALTGVRTPVPWQQGRTINPDAYRTVSAGADSKTMQPLGVIVKGKQRKLSINITGLPATWVENTFLSDWDAHLGESKPFIWKWNTEITTACYYMQVDPSQANFVSNYLDNTAFRNISFGIKGPKE
jgi:hypothetical protein